MMKIQELPLRFFLMSFHFDVNVDEDQRVPCFACVLSDDNVDNDGDDENDDDDDDDDGDDDNDDDNLHLVACLCVCFVRALSSHIRHTPPHPLLGQDGDDDDHPLLGQDGEDDYHHPHHLPDDDDHHPLLGQNDDDHSLLC